VGWNSNRYLRNWGFLHLAVSNQHSEIQGCAQDGTVVPPGLGKFPRLGPSAEALG
jgi:hypothetical protein